jgi:parallel beta-helix repeat protein
MKVDEATNTITVGGKECLCELRMGDRYFVENIFEELDSPGEWYLNKETGVLCLWPKGELSEKSEVVAPILGRVLDLEGASYIRLSGLEIRDTDYSPEDGCVGYGMGNDGAVYLAKSANCAIEDCRFLNVGKYAVCLSEGGDNRIVGNDIAQGAEGGILLLDSARNLVSDNHIHHCGLVYKHIGGVVLQGKGASDNAVSHNLVHDMSRYGITLKNPGLRNVVEFNHVCNLDTETYDTGGIEVTQHDRQLRTGSVIRNNIVHDVIGYSCTNDKDMFCAWGIYLDSFAGGYTVTSNIVYRNSHGGIMLQGGKGNRVENNIFVNSTKSQLYISNFSQNFEDEVVTGNIFYYTNPEAVLVGAGNLTDKVLTCDRNLYFLAGGKEIAIRGAGCKTFADWQKKGFDVNSIVADPMFVDPEKDDYTLRPESPAFKLGFKAIDTSQVGLLRKRCRCAIRPASEVFGWAQSR